MINQIVPSINLGQHHRLDPNDPTVQQVVANPALVGVSEVELQGMPMQQRAELLIGEYFALVSRQAGQLAAQLLEHAQWGFETPEWFDHRLHLLDSEKWFTDFWTSSADNVIEVMPLGARLLDLCSGDGFYDYHFFRHRASEIVCVELHDVAYNQAVRLHSAPNIAQVHGDVLSYQPPSNYYDVVMIRGAIEHFSRENQQKIMTKALGALKVGGWFCGDTVANPEKHHKMLNSHECEWADENEMRSELCRVFNTVETSTLVCTRTTYLRWRCRKDEQNAISEATDFTLHW